MQAPRSSWLKKEEGKWSSQLSEEAGHTAMHFLQGRTEGTLLDRGSQGPCAGPSLLFMGRGMGQVPGWRKT